MIEERAIMLVMLWAITASVAWQMVIHFATYVVIRNQRDRTGVGPALKRLFLSHGFRYGVMIAFHVVLAYVVTYDDYLIPTTGRIVLYIVVLGTSLWAGVDGFRLLLRLRDESWGNPRKENGNDHGNSPQPMA